MMIPTQPRSQTCRRGVTLLEVLLAIGILAVGLSSVVALVPAGRSQAARAVLLDRAANIAANALADAATVGLLRPDSLTGTTSPVLVDPAAATTYLGSGTLARLANTGVVGTGTTAAPDAYHRLFAQSRDDVLVAASTGDAPPTNSVRDGTRDFEGRTSCAYCIQFPTTPGDFGRLSVIVFHGRDPGVFGVSGTIQSGQISSGTVSGRRPQDILKPGAVLFGGGRLHRVTSAAFTGASSAFVTLSTGTLLTTSTSAVSVTILPDSVGLAERPFQPEIVSGFTQ